MFKSVGIFDLGYMKHQSRAGIKSQILKTKQPKDGAGTDENQSPDLTNRVRIAAVMDPRTRVSEQKQVWNLRRGRKDKWRIKGENAGRRTSERNGALLRFTACLSRGKYGSLKPAGGWGTGSCSHSTAATLAIKKRRPSKRGGAWVDCKPANQVNILNVHFKNAKWDWEHCCWLSVFCGPSIQMSTCTLIRVWWSKTEVTSLMQKMRRETRSNIGQTKRSKPQDESHTRPPRFWSLNLLSSCYNPQIIIDLISTHRLLGNNEVLSL